jgi:hypothetical protein
VWLAAPGGAAASPGGAGAQPPTPAIGEFSAAPAPLLDDNQAMAPAKRTSWKAMQHRLAQPNDVAAATPTRVLAEPLYQQGPFYYCGPATLAMVAQYLGVGFGGLISDKQTAAANLLGTTKDGTPWYGSDNVPGFPKSSWYPMEDALNYRLYKAGKQMWYDHVPLPNAPTTAQQVDFRNHLTFDIDRNYPEEDNQYSARGFEIGFQKQGTWQHWWSARGYANNGETTYFNDPASWSQGRMSSARTRGGAHTVVVALGGRGYIW